jgi:hypothetical protein
MQEGEANGIDTATLLHNAITVREHKNPAPLVPILDQLVQKAGWMTKACSG